MVKIIEEIQNTLFGRKEVKVLIESDSSPTISESINIISKEFSSDPSAIKIKRVVGEFGNDLFVIEANIYKTKEEKEELEVKTKKEIEREKKEAEALEAKKKAEQEAKATEVAKAEAPKEETPVETKVEEKTE